MANPEQGHEDIAEQCSVDREHQSEESRDPEQQQYKALDNHQKGEQDIVPVMQLSRSSNILKEVSLANNLLVFRFGQNYFLHASRSKTFIRNIKRPIMRRKLFVISDKIVANHINQRVVPLRETDSNKLVQPKLSTMFHINSIATWVALLISYLANIWSQVRHVSYNYFGFRNLKPRLLSCNKANANITTYSKSSEKECEKQVAKWGDVKSEPFGCLFPKPFAQRVWLEIKRCTFNFSMCDHIFDILLKNDYIMILDHHVEPSTEG
jgi:hypothetical protein